MQLDLTSLLAPSATELGLPAPITPGDLPKNPTAPTAERLVGLVPPGEGDAAPAVHPVGAVVSPIRRKP